MENSQEHVNEIIPTIFEVVAFNVKDGKTIDNGTLLYTTTGNFPLEFAESVELDNELLAGKIMDEAEHIHIVIIASLEGKQYAKQCVKEFNLEAYDGRH